jgi:hypothetical protein
MSGLSSVTREECIKAEGILKGAAKRLDGLHLSEERKQSLRDRINDGTITSHDLPASLRGDFPSRLEDETLNEIRALCRKLRS